MAFFSRSPQPAATTTGAVETESLAPNALIGLRNIEKSYAHGTSRSYVLRRINAERSASARRQQAEQVERLRRPVTQRDMDNAEADVRRMLGLEPRKKAAVGRGPDSLSLHAKAPADAPADPRIAPDRLRGLPLYELASLIRSDWQKPYFGAVPYLQALGSLSSHEESYGLDPGRHIVNYFLANANGWKGPVARAVKAELKRRVRS